MALFSKSGEVQESPEFELEILLMQADWYYKLKKYVIAKVMYDKAGILATGTFANLGYDGTYAESVAVMGLIQCNLIIDSKNTYITLMKPKIGNDGSFRAIKLQAKLISKGLMRYRNNENLLDLPYYNTTLISALEYIAKDICLKESDTKAILTLENILLNRRFLFDLYPLLISKYVHNGNIEASFQLIINYIHEDISVSIPSDHFWIFWKVIADLSDSQFKHLIKIWEKYEMLKWLNSMSNWKYSIYWRVLMDENIIRFGNKKEKKTKLRCAFNSITHPRYFERIIDYSKEWSCSETNSFECMLLIYLPALIQDYPYKRLKNLINYSRVIFEHCNLKNLKDELSYCDSHKVILPEPIITLPTNQVEKVPEFLNKLENYLKNRVSK